MKLMILDGNSIINRAFYGVRSLTAPDGTPTNAVFGFLNIFTKLLSDLEPDAVCVTFDLKAPTFRHKACSYYKAQRKPMPEELAVQLPIMKELLEKMGIRHYECEGYEADDILGTAGRICSEKGWECVIVTGDRDSLQLVSTGVSVCLIRTKGGKTESEVYTPELFDGEYGFPPKGLIDLKALMGDSSDNIPGVPGVGEKTALSLIRKYGSVDGVYAAIDSPDIKEGVRKKLREGEESARESYWLATIVTDVPVDFNPEDSVWNRSFQSGLYSLLLKLGFMKYIDRWHLTAEDEAAAPSEEALKTSAAETLEVTDENADALLSALDGCGYVSVLWDEGLGAVSVCDGRNVFNASRLSCFLRYDEILSKLFSKETKKVSHNVKNLMRELAGAGLPVDGFVFDTALAAYLISSTDSDYPLKTLSVKYLGAESDGSEACFNLYPALDAKLNELGMHDLYYSMELPLCEVLADMEIAGVHADRNALEAFGNELSASIETLRLSIWTRAGKEFNINSPRQLGDVLFEDLMLPYGKKTKTGWSTNADVLDRLRPFNPIVGEILEYRELSKLKSTYTDGLQKVIAPDGRIHSNFQMTVTATGRLSSTEPNLQNIPVRKQLGAGIRRMFTAQPGNVLVDADYSQIELRLLAHISGDENMRDAFLSGEDFHTVTASQAFNVPVEEVTGEMRSRAKAVNFGIIYGISAFSLSQDIGVMPREAQAYIDSYLTRFSGVKKYMASVVENAKTDGYVKTLYGRRRYLPELKNSSFNVRSFGERVARNMPVQGTAADIIKLAMISVFSELRARGLKARLILQVHDELIVECPEDEEQEVRQILKECMEGAAALTVPLVAETGSGSSWAEAH